MLDLWQSDAKIAAGPQPGEGTDLPGFYEMHGSQIIFGLEVMAVLTSAIALWLFRRQLRTAGIVILAKMLRIWRIIGSCVGRFWSEAVSRARDIQP